MQGYSPTAKERAMKMRDVLLEALAGKITWIQAAEVLGLSPRTMRRWRERFDESGIDGLYDGRRRSPSDRAIPAKTLAKWLRLYRDRYAGYNVRHFCSLARRKHGLTWSYTLMRNALQGAGLVRKRRPRGKHRMRREPRPCFGELLHLDGSRHRWLALQGDTYQHLIVVLDDATKQILYAQLEPCEYAHRDGGVMGGDRSPRHSGGAVFRPRQLGRAPTARSRIGWSTNSAPHASPRSNAPTATSTTSSSRTTMSSSLAPRRTPTRRSWRWPGPNSRPSCATRKSAPSPKTTPSRSMVCDCRSPSSPGVSPVPECV